MIKDYSSDAAMDIKTNIPGERVHAGGATQTRIRRLIAALTAIAAFFPPAGLQAAGSAENRALPHPGDTAHGKAIYQKHCHYCHGPKGRGDGPIGMAITPRPVDFTSDRRMLKTDDVLRASIANGIRREKDGKEMAMPRWKDILSEEDIRDVLAYVRELERGGRKNKKTERPQPPQGERQ